MQWLQMQAIHVHVRREDKFTKSITKAKCSIWDDFQFNFEGNLRFFDYALQRLCGMLVICIICYSCMTSQIDNLFGVMTVNGITTLNPSVNT